MDCWFSERGLSRLDQQIADQTALVRDAGQQVGEEAGPSCDWHDNFGFEEARRRLDLESEKLRGLIEIRRAAKLVDLRNAPKDVVTIGSTVAFSIDDEGPRTYTVGAWGETAPATGLIAYDSPLAALLLGLGPGDSREGHFKGKAVEIEVSDVQLDEAIYLTKASALYGTG